MKAPRGATRVTLKKWGASRNHHEDRWVIRRRVNGVLLTFTTSRTREDAWWRSEREFKADGKSHEFECVRVTLVTRED